MFKNIWGALERVAHEMRWVCDVIMRNLETRSEKSFSYLIMQPRSQGVSSSSRAIEGRGEERERPGNKVA